MTAVPATGAKLQTPELLEYDTSESLRGGNLKNSLCLDSSNGLIVAMADPEESAPSPCKTGNGSTGPAVATTGPMESKEVRGRAAGRG